MLGYYLLTGEQIADSVYPPDFIFREFQDMTTSALPTEKRPIRMDPELAAEVEKLLKPLKGKDLDVAQDAVMRVYQSGMSGDFGEILGSYKAAVEEAIG